MIIVINRFSLCKAANDASHLDIDDGSKLAEVFVELCDVVQLTWDLAHLQLGVHIVIPLGKTAFMLVVKAWPKTRGALQCSYLMFASVYFEKKKNKKKSQQAVI